MILILLIFSGMIQYFEGLILSWRFFCSTEDSTVVVSASASVFFVHKLYSSIKPLIGEISVA